MIQLTNNGAKSLYLIKFDERNLAIVVGAEPRDEKKGYSHRLKGYYGSVQSALKAAVDIQIKSGATVVETTEILQAIDLFHKRINELKYPAIINFLKGGCDA
jgi:hypothetical protein